jgi:murein DD-endopeptidase MepM/ murein hydrolase activator NlpD
MTPTKKSKLSTSFPHNKSSKSSTSNTSNKAQRNSSVLISSVYLFTPLLFVAPLSHVKPPVVEESLSDASSFVDLFTGMGGPEVVPMRSVGPLKEIQSKFDESSTRFDMFNQENQTSFTTVTRVVNHLKVANTVMPTTSPEITSEYGWRTPPCRGCSADHKGIDFVPGAGEPIFAVADGMVIEMGRNGGYGYSVKLKHLMANSEGVIEEWVTLYAHMKKDSFPEGMMIGSVVEAGETIGAVGNTGVSTGPHLHFELLINGEHVDPLPLIGTYEVIIVSEEDYPDYMFVGETFKRVETEIRYE